MLSHKVIFIIILITFFVMLWWLVLDNKSHNIDPQIQKELILLGLEKEIPFLSFDNDSWFYYNKRLCVGCGINKECNSLTSFCPKTSKQQAEAIKIALNNGEHPDCPLIY